MCIIALTVLKGLMCIIALTVLKVRLSRPRAGFPEAHLGASSVTHLVIRASRVATAAAASCVSWKSGAAEQDGGQ